MNEYRRGATVAFHSKVNRGAIEVLLAGDVRHGALFECYARACRWVRADHLRCRTQGSLAEARSALGCHVAAPLVLKSGSTIDVESARRLPLITAL